jgi:hypothetical protein
MAFALSGVLLAVETGNLLMSRAILTNGVGFSGKLFIYNRLNFGFVEISLLPIRLRLKLRKGAWKVFKSSTLLQHFKGFFQRWCV